MAQTGQGPALRWERSNIERRMGFKGTKYTGANTFLTFGIGVLMAIGFYVAMFPFATRPIGKMFYERGAVPYVIVLLSGWSLAIVFIKWRKLKLQSRALGFAMVPDAPDFVLSPLTVDEVLHRLYDVADNPKDFLLFNRMERSLANLKNIGRVSDVNEMLRSQAENDENYVDSTYTLIRGFVWAIPVFGFIGTVLGLSSAIGGFGEVLSSGAELDKLRESLQGVTGGLATAFETTLIGLVAAVAIQLLLTSLKKREEDFLDACNEYCHRNIVSKLRTVPVGGDSGIGDAV